MGAGCAAEVEGGVLNLCTKLLAFGMGACLVLTRKLTFGLRVVWGS